MSLRIREKPFSNVYLTGLVRDKQVKNVQTIGQFTDALNLIEEFGADAVR